MGKYYRADDVIRKYAEMIADEAYWEHGVGNGKPDEEDLDIAREYYSELPAIEVSEDCISREDAEKCLMSHFIPQTYTGDDVEQASKLARKIMSSAPSVIPTQTNAIQHVESVESVEKAKEGEWIIEEKDSIYGKKIRLTCSECGDVFDVTETAFPYERYCRYCGAKMKGVYDD